MVLSTQGDCWMTFANGDDEVRSALILAKSLRMTATNKRIILIISPTTPKAFRETLETEFDAVYLLPHSKWENMDMELRAKIFSWSLIEYQKLVFILNSSLVLTNADSIFDVKGVGVGKFGNLRLEPSFQTHMKINDWMEAQKKCPNMKDFEKFLFTDLAAFYLAPNYDYQLQLAPSPQLEIASPHILHFTKEDHAICRKRIEISLFKHVSAFYDDLETKVESLFSPTGPTPLKSSCAPSQNEPIAIVGVSCRLPGANNLDEYWRILVNGECWLSRVPEGRWTDAQSCLLARKHVGIEAGFLICPVDEFDAKFFAISPKGVPLLDPQQRLLMEVAWEALEDAAIDPHSLKGTHTGVFSGQWIHEYRVLMQSSGLNDLHPFKQYMGNGMSMTPSRLAFFFGLTGPNIGTDSGCSSSSVGMGLAIQSLREGKIDLALACGTNLILDSFTNAGVLGVLSSNFRCQTFDASANGYARAEGVGVLVLKRLSDAVKNGDRIYGNIRGFGVFQDGCSKMVGAPTVEGEAESITAALIDANVDPRDIQVVEAHGTGTAAGDLSEIGAINLALAAPNRTTPLIITGGKANIGHTEATSGIAGIIKILLCLREETIPGQILLETLHPEINLQSLPAIIPMENIDWKSNGYSPRIAAVNSFGISGTNTCAIVEEYIHQQSPIHIIGGTYPENILTLSAHSEAALHDLVNKYKQFLHQHNQDDFDNIAFTANTGRGKFPHRIAVRGENITQILSRLDKTEFESGETTAEEPKIIYLFTGQGSQYHGMGKVLYNTFPVFRVNFNACEEILFSLHGLRIKDAIFGDNEALIHESLFSQSSIFVIEYCLVKLLKSWGVKPTCVLGHSLGEFAAATTAGLLSLRDALLLLGSRCKLIDALPDGKMMAVNLSVEETRELLNKNGFSGVNEPSKWLDVAAINSNDQTTVSGPPWEVEEFKKFCKAQNVKCHILDATRAYHSRHMDQMVQEYSTIAESVTHSHVLPTCTFVSAVDGCALTQLNGNYWVRHTRDSVEFVKATQAKEVAISNVIFVEIGPHPVLSALFAGNQSSVDKKIIFTPTMRRSKACAKTEFGNILDALARLFVNGININFNEFHSFHKKEKIQLPFYAFQRKKYWFPPTGIHLSLLNSRKEVHTLLGSQLDIPQSKDVYFENFITLDTHAFIGDHRIGFSAIFPGAGYISLLLGAAMCRGVWERITLENFVIHAPLVVEEKVVTVLHTVVPLNNEDGVITGKMYGRKGVSENALSGKWILHSESQIRLNTKPSGDENELKEPGVEDLNNIRTRVTSEEDLRNLYTELAKVGYNFGPMFQPIKKIWNVGSEEFLVELQLHNDLNLEGDAFHPTLLDGLIQVYLAASKGQSHRLRLPISIRTLTFHCPNRKATDATYYAHVHSVESGEKRGVLYSSSGDLLVVIEGVQFITTTVEFFEKSISVLSGKIGKPSFMEEVWCITPLAAETKTIEVSNELEKTPSLWILLQDESDVSNNLENLLKKNGNEVAVSNWLTVDKSNFDVIQTHPHAEGIVIFCSQLEIFRAEDNKELVASAYKVLQTFLSCLQVILSTNFKQTPRVILLTRGRVKTREEIPLIPVSSAVAGMFRTFQSESGFMNCKTIDLSPDVEEGEAELLLSEILSQEIEPFVSFREGIRLTMHMKETHLRRERLALPPNSPRFKLVLPLTKSISDLKFITTKNKKLRPCDVEVEVKAAGLNFKNIFIVLKPIPEFDNLNSIGEDFSGVVVRVGDVVTKWKIGDAVFGTNINNEELPSHVIAREDSVLALPEQMSHLEGATAGTPFATAFICLVEIAELKKGEQVLIHTASGGVGHFALQIAKYIGAEVFATAGSKSKLAYLRHIGVKYVFNSRDLKFGEGILEATGGEGVDVVLNSLTGQGFKETSLKVCKKNARFVEMSKLNIWSAEEVDSLRPDVAYSIFDLLSLSDHAVGDIIPRFTKYMHGNVFPAPPITTFPATEIRDALMHLQTASHIGRVVMVMPERTHSEDYLLFNNRSTYLVTGGTKGIGLEVLKWMCVNGAETVVITGRNKLTTDSMNVVQNLRKEGKKIHFFMGDISELGTCKTVLEFVKRELPPLKGIMHCAGVIQDATIPNQTAETLEIALNPKLAGGWNLHRLTMKYQLEHFVLFSSLSAVIGTPGQSNYVAGNGFLDGLAHYRRGLGLAATSINWGPWAEVGLVAGKNIKSITSMLTSDCLNVLKLTLRSNKTQLTVAINEDAHLWVTYLPWTQAFIPVRDENTYSLEASSRLMTSEQFWIQFESAVGDEEKEMVVYNALQIIFHSTLKMEINENIGAHENLMELGVDSLMMIVIKNKVQVLLGSSVTIISNGMINQVTLDLLAKHMVRLINQKNIVCEPMTEEEFNRRINEDSELPQHIQAEDKLALVPLSEVCTVFFTGATGSLGPYMLEELTKMTQIKVIYCLIRCVEAKNGAKKLDQWLLNMGMKERIDMSKIEIVVGDITQPRMGIEENIYKLLVEKVEMIIHCASYVNHVETYSRNVEKDCGLRAVNVTGTMRMLEFAGAFRTKWVYHATSAFGFWVNEDEPNISESLPEDWPLLANLKDVPDFGYGITKHISDRLVAEAVRRGIPCRAFRFPKIFGESETGRLNITRTHFALKFLYYITSGVMPDIPIPLIIVPVDVAAKITLKVLFDDTASSGMFNIGNPTSYMETDIANLAKEFGPVMRIAQRFSALGECRDFLTYMKVIEDYGREVGVDFAPLLEIIKDSFEINEDLLAHPNRILLNKKVREFLTDNCGYKIRVIPYEEFVAHLVKDGGNSILFPWLEFYTKEDSIYRLINPKRLELIEQHRNSDERLKALGRMKLETLVPEFKELIGCPIEIVRKMINYVIVNGPDIFHQKKLQTLF